MTSAESARVSGKPERRARAERISSVLREMLLNAADEGRATGSISVNLKDGLALTIRADVITGERDGWALPDLRTRQ